MRVSVIGSGYVGLVTGTCFAETGNEVVCMDVDEQKVEKMKMGIVPIYEPGREGLLIKNISAEEVYKSVIRLSDVNLKIAHDVSTKLFSSKFNSVTVVDEIVKVYNLEGFSDYEFKK